MQTLTKEKIVFEFNKNNKFNYSVQNNEIFSFRQLKYFKGESYANFNKRKDSF